MDPRTFALAYRRDPVSPRSYGPRVDKLLVRSRCFAHGFGRLLHDALTGRRLPEPDQYRTWAVRYTTWLNQGMGGLEHNLHDLLNALRSPEDFTRVFMELNFHRLNAPVTSWWEVLLYGAGEKSMPGESVTRARYELAKTAMAVVQSRDEWVERDLYFDDELAELRQWSTGALTEMDGMLAMLELCRRVPGTFVLPAPPQFEHMAGPANVDLIVVNPLVRYRVRGVQLKSSGTHRHIDRYDSERVTLIDGVIDMFNERAMRSDPRRSDMRVVAWPGLVSAHYLAELPPSSGTEAWVDQPEIRSAAAMANRATQSIVSHNQQIFELLVQRIETDLGGPAQNGDGQSSGVPPGH
ncbi:hypothetical protein [uncultured Aeromicrobium sp.]|uniref:hypothetical protein n=1 Tax=uncultured Aeromicrobium sp. TaxID=337820 RepID=UPI0025F91C42|nr:hypothetical protein [uncultured Aeromicrobium sp.]